MNASDRILIAGIGNIFFGDDAFGGEVIKELIKSPLPEGVDAVDFGIRSYDLAYAIMDGYAATILVDITARGEPPGTVYLIELDQEKIGSLEATAPDGHSLDPVAVLRLTQSLGGQIERLYLVACEPATSVHSGRSPTESSSCHTATSAISQRPSPAKMASLAASTSGQRRVSRLICSSSSLARW